MYDCIMGVQVLVYMYITLCILVQKLYATRRYVFDPSLLEENHGKNKCKG